MNGKALIFFRDQLRFGRETALKDAEGFSEILFAVERLGSFLSGEVGTLRSYLPAIQHLACDSPLGKELPKIYPGLHLPFYRLYDLVMQARNDALHQGAYARHLTGHAIELSIVIEDALMNNLKTVAEFMVSDVLCCSLWQPLSLIRQKMLANDFSFLPVRIESGEWRLLSDYELARYLRVKKQVRNERLTKSLESVLVAHDGHDTITLLPVKPVCPTEPIDEIAKKLNSVPALVTRDGGHTDLVGILTAFDLL
jgi:CBS domain-containing protein